jgi:putative membrane protein
MNVKDRFHEASVEIHHGIDVFTGTVRRVARGTASGFIGGVLASWMMNQYKAIESRPVKVRREEMRQRYAAAATRSQATPMHEAQAARSTAPQVETEKGDQATVKLAEHVSRNLFDHPLTPAEKKIAGPTVHFGYGGLVGALYGGLSELIPTVSIGLGIPYATVLWLVGSEVAVPAMGLSKPATEVPVEKHASNMATHFVYGLTLDISRRILRRVL